MNLLGWILWPTSQQKPEDLTPSASPHVLALLQPLPLFAIEPLSNTNRSGLDSFSI